MIRVIKRYESRKLYDTEESRYVSLEEIADWVRSGQEVRVVDNATSEEVTAHTLSQIILEEGRSGRSRLPTQLLHELIRRGEDVVATGVGRVQSGVDRLVQASLDRFGPMREAREEMVELRERLEQLEAVLVDLESEAPAQGKPTPTRKGKATKKSPRRKKSTPRPPAKRASQAEAEEKDV